MKDLFHGELVADDNYDIVKSPCSSAQCATQPQALTCEFCNFAASGDLEAVRALLAQGAQVNQVVGQDGTALHWAARMGRKDVVQELLDAGADVSVTNAQDDTPYAVARDCSPCRDVVALLEQHCPQRSEASWDR